MPRIDDNKLLEIYETRFAKGVPDRVSVGAHKVTHLLVAARDPQDIDVLGTILQWPNSPKRYGIQIYGKWHVTFAWSNTFADKIRLERR